MSNGTASGTEAMVTLEGDGVRLRDAARLDSAALASLPRGAVVTLDGRFENGYAGVGYQGFSGFAFSPYFTTLTDDLPVAKIARVTGEGDGLRLRSAPTLSASVLATMAAGTLLADLAADTDGFLRVSYDGLPGFAGEQFLRRGSDANPWARGEDKLPADWRPVDQWRSHVERALTRVRNEYGTAPHKHRALATIYIESRGFPNAEQTNPWGNAYGLMQLTRNAWTADLIDFSRIFDPDYNVFCGTRELAVRHNAFRDNPDPNCLRQDPWDAASYGYFGGDPCGDGLCDPVTGMCPGPYHELLQRLMRGLDGLEERVSEIVSEIVDAVAEAAEGVAAADILPDYVHSEAQAKNWFGRVVTADGVHEFRPSDDVTRVWVAYGRETGLWPPLKAVERTKEARYFRFENGLVVVANGDGARVARD